MTTGDLVGKLADNWEMEPEEIREILDVVVQNMCDQLALGNEFTIPRLGTFRTITRGKSRIYDEQTKQHKISPPERIVDFKPAPDTETGLNAAEVNDE